MASRYGDPRSYPANEVVDADHPIWNFVHPEIRANKDSILGYSGSADKGKYGKKGATGNIVAGALIAADAVFRNAAREGVQMKVAVGGGSNRHSWNHGNVRSHIGESIDIKPVAGWKDRAQRERYAGIAAGAGANRLGVSYDNHGMHVQVSTPEGSNAPTTAWKYGGRPLLVHGIRRDLKSGKLQEDNKRRVRYAFDDPEYDPLTSVKTKAPFQFKGAPIGAVASRDLPYPPLTGAQRKAKNPELASQRSTKLAPAAPMTLAQRVASFQEPTAPVDQALLDAATRRARMAQDYPSAPVSPALARAATKRAAMETVRQRNLDDPPRPRVATVRGRPDVPISRNLPSEKAQLKTTAKAAQRPVSSLGRVNDKTVAPSVGRKDYKPTAKQPAMRIAEAFAAAPSTAAPATLKAAAARASPKGRIDQAFRAAPPARSAPAIQLAATRAAQRIENPAAARINGAFDVAATAQAPVTTSLKNAAARAAASQQLAPAARLAEAAAIPQQPVSPALKAAAAKAAPAVKIAQAFSAVPATTAVSPALQAAAKRASPAAKIEQAFAAVPADAGIPRSPATPVKASLGKTVSPAAAARAASAVVKANPAAPTAAKVVKQETVVKAAAPTLAKTVTLAKASQPASRFPLGQGVARTVQSPVAAKVSPAMAARAAGAAPTASLAGGKTTLANTSVPITGYTGPVTYPKGAPNAKTPTLVASPAERMIPAITPVSATLTNATEKKAGQAAQRMADAMPVRTPAASPARPAVTPAVVTAGIRPGLQSAPIEQVTQLGAARFDVPASRPLPVVQPPAASPKIAKSALGPVGMGPIPQMGNPKLRDKPAARPAVVRAGQGLPRVETVQKAVQTLGRVMNAPVKAVTSLRDTVTNALSGVAQQTPVLQTYRGAQQAGMPGYATSPSSGGYSYGTAPVGGYISNSGVRYMGPNNYQFANGVRVDTSSMTTGPGHAAALDAGRRSKGGGTRKS